MADQDPNEFVYVRLSSHGADVTPGRVTRQAFDQVWKDKGWVIVDDEAVALANSPDAAILGTADTTTKKKG